MPTNPAPTIDTYAPDGTGSPYPERSKQSVGRPCKLTRERHDKIVHLIRGGTPEKVAAGIAGVSERTFGNWMRWGRTIHDAEQAGEPLEDRGNNKIYLLFFLDVTRARQELESFMAMKWRKIGTEGLERVKTTYEYVANEEGEVEKVATGEERTVTGDGDWRAIAEYLCRRYPERWSRRETREITGEGGGPVRMEHSAIPADRVIQNLSPAARKELLEQIEAVSGAGGVGGVRGAGGENGNVVEAEYVDRQGTGSAQIGRGSLIAALPRGTGQKG